MQPTSSEGAVAGNGAAVAGGPHPADPAQARAAWEQPIGFSVTLSPSDVEGAIRALAYKASREETYFRHKTQIHWGPGGEAEVGVPLTAEQVARALKERAYTLTRDRGVTVPVDEIEFHARAEVNWIEGGAAAVVLEV